MIFVRLAELHIPHKEGAIRPEPLRVQGVDVDYRPGNVHGETEYGQLRAFTQLNNFEPKGKNYPASPSVLSKCANFIESYANIIATLNRSSRKIIGSIPCFALIPQDDADRRKLTEVDESALSSGIRFRDLLPISGLSSVPQEILSTRPDGISLMAEAYSNSNATGQYREFVRLFEAAFNTPFTQLDKKLNKFLENNFQYSRQEIKKWIALRHPTTHADKRCTNWLAYERDVLPHITRIEQAALDVLFNKKQWGSGDTQRNQTWRPSTSITGEKHNISSTVGQKVMIQTEMTDSLNGWTINDSRLTPNYPKDWWWPNRKS